MTESARKSPPSDNRNRNREQGTAALRERGAAGTPVVRDTRPELLRLLEKHEAGRLDPAEVRLGKMPADATLDMRMVAEDMRLLMGLRLAVGQPEPLPYATPFACERLGWDDPVRASRALRRLCDAGVIHFAGSLPRRGKRDGTKTYEPPLLGASSVEGDSVAVEPVGAFEPELEVADDGLVGDAVPTVERGESLIAVANGADRAIVHATDGSGETGGSDPDVERAERIRARHEDLAP